MLLFKLFLFLFPMALLAGEVVWDGNGAMSANEQKRAIREYVQMKYPNDVKAWDKQEKNTITIDGLMWQDNRDAKTVNKNWLGAKDYCANLQLIGYNDWYLPSKEQLQQLYLGKDRLKNISSDYYWSSTTNEGNRDYAWIVSFDSAGVYIYGKGTSDYVRCVREDQ